MAGKKELPEEVFWRDLEEITSHARPVARSATKTGRMEQKRERERERERERDFSLSLERAHAPRRGGMKRKKEKPYDDLIVAGSAEKSFLSRHIRQ